MSTPWARVSGLWPLFPSLECLSTDLRNPLGGTLVSGQVTLYGPQRVTESHLDLLESPGDSEIGLVRQ